MASYAISLMAALRNAVAVLGATAILVDRLSNLHKNEVDVPLRSKISLF